MKMKLMLLLQSAYCSEGGGEFGCDDHDDDLDVMMMMMITMIMIMIMTIVSVEQRPGGGEHV